MPRKKRPKAKGYHGFLQRVLRHPPAVQAAYVLTFPAAIAICGLFVLSGYMAILSRDLPSLSQIENPELDYATVAYTADGVELARFGRQNRSWMTYEEISEHVRHALIATEDHRFDRHWGMDLFRTFSAAAQSALWKLGLPFERQGGSTITQQLARNLYNEQIGFEVSIARKLKEMATAVQLERLYTKQEIAEMYLNTVPFRHNAYGIEAAARTYFAKGSAELDVLESAALVGMLKGTYRYDPERNPELSRQRRNTVMRRMIRMGWLDREFYDTYRDSLTAVNFRSADVTKSFAPYFAEQVRQWLTAWGKESNIDVYGAGLVVHTTLDSRVQALAHEAVDSTMNGLQAVVDCEWSAATSPRLTYLDNLELYRAGECHTVPENRFAWFWDRYPDMVNSFVRESGRYNSLVGGGDSEAEALSKLTGDATFMDSLKTTKTRLENGLVALDPRTGHVKAWVGGRDLALDWYDHVSIAERQPGSTFKPFVYATAVDNGYSPNALYTDSLFEYVDPYTGDIWSPRNSGGEISGNQYTLREGLARSLNTITGQVMLDVKPENVARLATVMGITTELDPVPALALGTSDVTLLDMAAAYSTLANNGIRNDPVLITRVRDRYGVLLYESQPAPREALSEDTAPIMIDMLRDVVNQSYGTGHRVRWQYELDGYDFAGKTGTTQEGADGWFILMHPELVTGAWVGFNDRRVTFRSDWWGQGGHNALYLVGDLLNRVNKYPDIALSMDERFPDPPAEFAAPIQGEQRINPRRRVVW